MIIKTWFQSKSMYNIATCFQTCELSIHDFRWQLNLNGARVSLLSVGRSRNTKNVVAKKTQQNYKIKYHRHFRVTFGFDKKSYFFFLKSNDNPHIEGWTLPLLGDGKWNKLHFITEIFHHMINLDASHVVSLARSWTSVRLPYPLTGSDTRLEGRTMCVVSIIEYAFCWKRDRG